MIDLTKMIPTSTFYILAIFLCLAFSFNIFFLSSNNHHHHFEEVEEDEVKTTVKAAGESPSSTPYRRITLQQPSYASHFFNIATNMRTSSSLSSHANSSYFPRIHLMRVPKAYSSSFSAVARRFAGCHPPGPCCRFPGSPVGSCFSFKLIACEKEGRVAGCTDHVPNIHLLADESFVSIAMMREPRNRSLSAFFYPNHHDDDCKHSLEVCFEAFCKDIKYRNIVVKMLGGSYPYSEEETCFSASSCKLSLDLAINNLKRLNLMAIAEMWELSMLVLYYQFPMIPPNIVELEESFELNTNLTRHRSNSSVQKLHDRFARHNRDTTYTKFKNQAFSTPRLLKLLEDQNSLDYLLYQTALELLCDHVHSFGIWEHRAVRSYWKERATRSVKRCES